MKKERKGEGYLVGEKGVARNEIEEVNKARSRKAFCATLRSLNVPWRTSGRSLAGVNEEACLNLTFQKDLVKK